MARTTTTPATASQMKPAALRTFHAQLGAWYAAHGRHDLPWRQTNDPYRIWISEVMLQQTQVQTVLARFYHPFLAKFPTIEALAAAPREAVMKAWEGLGYYRRAGNLHEAAKQAVTHRLLRAYVAEGEPRSGKGKPSNGGASPPSINQLVALPGIGRNTASAILAFAYHQPVAILEANVKRVVARIFALSTPSDAELWQGAETLLNRATPFDYNQAMMDLGSLVCTPKAPNCAACPARTLCKGKASPETFPTPKAKKQVPVREVTIHVREDAQGRLFLERREEALLGGLYGFPQSSITASGNSIGTVTHIYSHFKLIGTVVHEALRTKPNSIDWHTREEITALPLSKLDHKVLALVENCHSAAQKKSKAPSKHRKR